MPDERFEFKKDSHSKVNIDRILMMVVLISAAIGFYVFHQYITSFIFLVISIWGIYNYFQIPNYILLDDKGINYGKTITWESIEEVEFTNNALRDLSDSGAVLRIKGENRKPFIHIKLYENSRELRILFEKTCVEKGVKYIVKDKGFYK